MILDHAARIAVNHANYMGLYAKIFKKILLSILFVDKYMETYAIMPSLKRNGLKERNFGGEFPGKEVSKTISDRGGQD